MLLERLRRMFFRLFIPHCGRRNYDYGFMKRGHTSPSVWLHFAVTFFLVTSKRVAVTLS